MKAIKFAEKLIKSAPGLSRSGLASRVKGFWSEENRKIYGAAAESSGLGKVYERKSADVGLGAAYEAGATEAGLAGKEGAYGRLWIP